MLGRGIDGSLITFWLEFRGLKKQGRIHGSISRVRVGRGSMVAGQG